MLLHGLFGGEGYRVIHGSGMIWARQFPAQFRGVVWDGFFNGVLGISTNLLTGGSGFRTVHAWALLLLSTALLVSPALSAKKEWGDIFFPPILR